MSRLRRVMVCALIAGLGAGGVVAVIAASSSDPAEPVAGPLPVASAPPVAAPVVAPPARPAASAAVPVKKPVVVRAKPRAVVAAPVVKKKSAPVVVRPVAKAVTKPVAKPVRVETPTQRGMRVLASLHYDWKRLGYRIVFLPEKRGYLGFTDGGTHTVTIWVRSRQSDLILAHTIAHELGHALDFSHGNDAKHAAYLTLRGLSPLTDWYGCNGCTDYRTPAGDWAEVFAYWLAGPGDFRSEMGPPPNKAQMKAIAQLYKY